MFIILLFIIATCCSPTATADDTTITASDLRKASWIGHCKSVVDACPVLSNATAIPVARNPEKKLNGTLNLATFNFTVNSFLGIEEMEQQFTLQGTFEFAWQLPACARWTKPIGDELPTYCAISRDSMWHPVLYHANAVGKDSPFEKGVDQITVTYEGEAAWLLRGQFDSGCTLSFKNFPFDEQYCSMIIAWERPADSQFVGIVANIIVLEDAVSESDVYQMLSFKNITYYSNGALQVEFSFHFKRRPEVYTGTLFVPMVLLMIIQVSIFLLPAEMADRAGLSMTVFLSAAVLLTLISENIPSTPEVLGVVVAFAAQTALGVLVTIYSVFACRLADNYAEKYRESFVTLPGTKFQCTIINLIDSIVCLLTFVAYFIMGAVLMAFMVTNATYSPFYTPPPEERIFQTDEVHRSLGLAASEGRLDDVKQLLELPGIDMGWWDSEATNDCNFTSLSPTALRRAVACNRTEVAKYLISQGARVAEVDERNPETYLILSVLNNNTKLVRMFLDRGVNVNEFKNESYIFNALAASAFTGMYKITGILTSRGARVNDKNCNRTTALMIAATHNKLDVSNILMSKGADVLAKDVDGRSATDMAAAKGSYYPFRRIWEKIWMTDGNMLSPYSLSALKEGALTGQADPIWLLLVNQNYITVDLTDTNANGETPLIIAIKGSGLGYQGDHVQVIKYLLDYADNNGFSGYIEQADNKGLTPLMAAVQLPTSQVTELLLSRGADIAAVDTYQWTPFYWAVYNGTYETAMMLVNNSADISIGTDSDVIYYAAGNKDPRILPWMYHLRSGSTAMINSYSGKTALIYASQYQCIENVKFLLERGAIDTKISTWTSALSYAVYADNYPIARMLLDKSTAFIDHYMDGSGTRPLHVAAFRGNSSMLFLLLAYGANPNLYANYYFNPIISAILGREPLAAAEMLIDNGAIIDDPQYYTTDYWSPLMFAVMKPNPAVVQLLIDRGSDLNAKTKLEELTPLLFAVSFGNVENVEILLKQQNLTTFYDLDEMSGETYDSVARTANEFIDNHWPCPPGERAGDPDRLKGVVNKTGRVEAVAMLAEFMALRPYLLNL